MNSEYKNNPFVRLGKWAHNQEENFTTETFIFLLNHIKDNHPDILLKILNGISNNFFQREDMNNEIEIINQYYDKITNKRPDISIKVCEKKTQRLLKIIFIEVKVWSQLHSQQLYNYHKILNSFPLDSNYKKLILLTPNNIILSENEQPPDQTLYWKDIASTIKQYQKYLNNDVSLYLTNTFIDFLRKNGLYPIPIRDNSIFKNLQNVFIRYKQEKNFNKKKRRAIAPREILNDPDMKEFRQLFNYIESAMAKSNISQFSIQGGHGVVNWIAYSIQNMKYFVGIEENKPDKIIFQCHQCKSMKDKMGVWDPDMYLWENYLYIDNTFYKLDTEQQEDKIFHFIQESYKYAEANLKKID